MIHKKKICWITADNFIQVDEPIICLFNKNFDLKWFVVFGNTNPNVVNKMNYVDQFAKQNQLNTNLIFLKYRFRNLKIILQFYKLLKSIKKNKPDIIYFNILGYPYFYVLVLLVLGRNKVIYAEHDVVDHYKMPHRKIMQLYKRFVFICFRNFQTFSNNQYQIFVSKYKTKKVFMAPLCLSDYGSSMVTPPNKYIRFLFFGSIRENKGLGYLIEAGNNLSEKYRGKFIITIAGNCPEWSKYEGMLKCKEVFEINIQIIPNNKIPDLFSSSHYLVLPYIDVTQSGPLLIAFNYNLPVIASDLPGFKEYIINKDNGYLFESQNVRELSGLMENLILDRTDNYDRIKKNLKKFTEDNISTESIINKYVDFFNSIS